MVFRLKSVRSMLLTRFYSVVAMDTLSNEIISSYETILSDISFSYGYTHILLLSAAILYSLLQNHHKTKRIEHLFAEFDSLKQHIRGILIVLFLVLTRNVSNAI